MLTTEQKQTFAEEGYLVFKELFPKTLMEEILHEAKIIVNQESPSCEEEGVFQFWDASVFLRYPAFVKALESPIFEELRESVGADLRLMTAELTSSLVLCPSGQGMSDWHRDSDFINPPEFQPNQVILHIYLQDTTSNVVGPMRVLPGSHNSNYQLNHSNTFESIAGEVNLAFPSGTVIVVHDKLWHINGPNNSDRDYWILAVRYGRPKAT